VRKYRDKNRPHLRFVVNWREEGKRKRQFFATKEEANTVAEQINTERENKGREGAEFPSALREMARECADMLSKFQRTIRDATDFYLQHLVASQKSCAAVELVQQLVIAKKKDGASQRHLDDIRSRLSIFAQQFDGQPVATIATAEIDDWLRSLNVSPVTRNHYRRLLVLAFNFAVHRGYATENPAENSARAKEAWKPPKFLTVSQTARLLESADVLLPYIAIGVFAGLRRSEIERLDWSEIDFDSDTIEVSPESKTSHRRAPMLPNLRAWLLPVRKHKGAVVCDNFRKVFDETRVAAGIAEWPDNALRHGFASYRLADIKDAAQVAYEMGTSEQMIKKNYDGRAKPKDAERYWNIRPSATEKVVPMVAR
jgi:integrase